MTEDPQEGVEMLAAVTNAMFAVYIDTTNVVIGYDPQRLLPPPTFTCAVCGGTFGKSRSDEEAMAETNASHPGVAQEDCAVVCEDCFRPFHVDYALIEERIMALLDPDGPWFVDDRHKYVVPIDTEFLQMHVDLETYSREPLTVVFVGPSCSGKTDAMLAAYETKAMTLNELVAHSLKPTMRPKPSYLDHDPTKRKQFPRKKRR